MMGVWAAVPAIRAAMPVPAAAARLTMGESPRTYRSTKTASAKSHQAARFEASCAGCLDVPLARERANDLGSIEPPTRPQASAAMNRPVQSCDSFTADISDG